MALYGKKEEEVTARRLWFVYKHVAVYTRTRGGMT